MAGAWRRGLRSGAAVVLLAAAGALAAPAGAGAAAATGDVYVVQALVGTPVSVELDGRQIVASAQPKTIVGPLREPAGQHVLVLRSGTKVVTSARFTVVAGQSIDAVAHRAADAAMTPRVVVFRNDLSPVGPGKARLVVAHVAVAPPADIRVSGTVLFHDVASGESLSLLVPAKTYSVDVVASVGGGDDPGARPAAREGRHAHPRVRRRETPRTAPRTPSSRCSRCTSPVRAARRRCRPATAGRPPTQFVGDHPARLPAAVLAAGVGALLLLRTRRRAALRLRRHVR